MAEGVGEGGMPLYGNLVGGKGGVTSKNGGFKRPGSHQAGSAVGELALRKS